MENMIEHYNAVMRDLEQRIARCEQEMRGYKDTLSQIRKLASAQANLFAPSPASGVPAVAVSSGRYAGMSVRWAILCLLGEDHSDPLATSQIADILTQGGMTTKGESFPSNVSAVLSVMKRDRNEVELVEGGYRLTANGQAAWHSIKLTPQYQNRISGASSVQ
jgi:hypothetical protein